MHSSSNSGGKWDIFLFQALCVNLIVVPSLIKCHCPDYPAVRQRSKRVSSNGREQGGGYANEMLTDPATITNHQSDLISWLTDWMSVCLDAYQANSPQLHPLFQHHPLSTYTIQSLNVHHSSITVVDIWRCLFPDIVWNTSKSSLEAQLTTILTWRQIHTLKAYSPFIC